MRQNVIAGNWKMYKTIDDAVCFTKELAPLIDKAESAVYLAVPYTAIKPVADIAKKTAIVVGSQNMNDASEGAFTGEIAAKMLIDAGAKFVILGHSERRHVFNETNEFINRKVRKALDEGLQPILCVGETLEEREEGKTKKVIKEQLLASLDGVTPKEIETMIFAYEPVWAIGTGKTATPDQAQEMHAYCRKCISAKWSPKTAKKVVIQYGGSVKPDNANELMSQPDIDGLLVGGASLEVESFSQIVNYR